MLKLTHGDGFCSACEVDSDELVIILTDDDPVAFCPDCKKKLIDLLSNYKKESSDDE